MVVVEFNCPTASWTWWFRVWGLWYTGRVLADKDPKDSPGDGAQTILSSCICEELFISQKWGPSPAKTTTTCIRTQKPFPEVLASGPSPSNPKPYNI